MKKLMLGIGLLTNLCFADGIIIPPVALPLSVLNGGTGVTTSTGSGSNVLSTSPTLTTPSIGVASGTSVSLTGLSVINNNASAAVAPVTGALMQVIGADGNVPAYEADGYANGPMFIARRANGTQAAPSGVGSGSTILAINGYGYGSTGFSSAARVGINFVGQEAWSDSAQGTRMSFSTTAATTTTTSVKMTLTNGGVLGVGYTSDQGGGQLLQVNGNALFSGVSYKAANPTPSACGTSPSVDPNSSNYSGTVTVGTVAAPSCTITFAAAFSSYNHCSITSQSTIASFAYSYTLSAITVTGTSLVSDKIDYRCDGV